MEQVSKVVIPISVFLSYAPVPEDDALRQKLEKHLRLLQRRGIITTYHRCQVYAGANWQQILDEQLKTASIILLLISVDFLDSDYCYGSEMERALTRHRAGEARVIPILLRPTYLQGAPFEHLQCLPRNGQSISEWENPDKAFQEIVAEIHMAIQDLFISPKNQQSEKERLLLAMCSDHRGFINNRLANFVGRQRELDEVKQRIMEKLPTGGYVTITGQAGQGKSCIIAKLVEINNPENVAHHFIPLNPGPDYQVALLRNIMARLILKHDLSDLYVTSESRAVLRDYFPKILSLIAEKHAKEVIFIDGLDQLEEELTGLRDLSFLPNNPPAGIVFVLGTRPNDTLRPLELLKPYHEYKLPNMARDDFALILSRRGVEIQEDLVDRFYKAMQANALYLDLLAAEIATHHTKSLLAIIERVSDDPNNIFSLSIGRLRKKEDQWERVIKPVLGLLLVANEPLKINHICQILSIENDAIRKGLQRLGGLLAVDSHRKYYLYHLKFRDYLKEKENSLNEEYIFTKDDEKYWHGKLANWCEQNNIEAIWQDVDDVNENERRLYGRRHYIAHLDHAENWEKLWNVLDDGNYGKSKIKYDPSAYSYIQDLDIARRAIVQQGQGLEVGISMLPRLWKYTLLRCSLTSIADKYPSSAFELLMLLKREREAIGLAELVTSPIRKAKALLLISQQMEDKEEKERDRLQMLLRACEIARLIDENNCEKWKLLEDLSASLVKLKYFEQAEEFIYLIDNESERIIALGKLGQSLTKMGQWDRAKLMWLKAETLAKKMPYWVSRRSEILRTLGEVLSQVQMWKDAERVIKLIEVSDIRSEGLQVLGENLARAGYFAQSESVIRSIAYGKMKILGLSILGYILSEKRYWNKAKEIYDEVEKAVWNIDNIWVKAKILNYLVLILIQIQDLNKADRLYLKSYSLVMKVESSFRRDRLIVDLGGILLFLRRWKQCGEIYNEINQKDIKVIALCNFGKTLFQYQEWVNAENVFKEAKATIYGMEDNDKKLMALADFGIFLIKQGQQEYAEEILINMEDIIYLYGRDDKKIQALSQLCTFLVKSRQWDRAEIAIRVIPDADTKTKNLQELGEALAQAELWDRAEELIRSIEQGGLRARSLQKLGEALAQAGLWDRAEELIRSIKQSGPRIKGLKSLGILLANARHVEHAKLVCLDVGTSMRDFETNNENADIQRELALALAEIGQWREAEFIISTIKQENARINAFRDLSIKLVESGKWREADILINTVEEYNFRGMGILKELGIALARGGEFNRARSIFDFIEIDDEREDAIREISAISASFGLWDQAEKLIKSMKAKDVKANAWIDLGFSLMDAGLRERAEKVWIEAKKIFAELEYWKRDVIIREFSISIAKVGLWEEAMNLAFSMKYIGERVEVLVRLACEAVNANRWEQAMMLVDAVEKGNERDNVLETLIRECAKAGQWERALILAHTIEGGSRKCTILEMLAEQAMDMSHWELADKIWKELEVAKEDADRILREELANTSIKAFDDVKRGWKPMIQEDDVPSEYELDEIEDFYTSLYNFLPDPEEEMVEEGRESNKEYFLREKTIFLYKMIEELIYQGQWEQCKEIIEELENNQQKIEILIEAGRVLTKVRNWELASVIWAQVGDLIDTITNIQQRDEMLLKLSYTLIDDKQLYRAEAIINLIEQVGGKARVQEKLSLALADSGLWKQSEAVACSIAQKYEKIKSLQYLGIRLAKEEQWEKAMRIIHMIDDIEARTKTLKELSNILYKKRKMDRILYLTQYSLLSVNSKKEALELICIMENVIHNNSSISEGIFDAFNWVDEFLKR